MSKYTINLLLLFALGGCATIDKTPPIQVQNACSILDEKNKWEKPIFSVAKEWKISPGTILAIMRQESGFRHNARPKDKNGKYLSSALGYSQALDGTWEEYEKSRGKAKRKDFSDSADFIGWYADRVTKITPIKKNDPRNLYLAFHEGAGGYNRATYRNKAWLINVADKVANNARQYDAQLFECERRKMKRFVNSTD